MTAGPSPRPPRIQGHPGGRRRAPGGPRLWLLSLLLPLGLLGLWLSGGGEGARGAAVQAPGQAPEVGGQLAQQPDLDAGVSAGSLPATPSIQAQASLPAPERAPLESAAPGASQVAASSLELRVVSHLARAPLAGAEVRLLGPQAPANRAGRVALPRASHRDRELLATVEAQADGLARIELPAGVPLDKLLVEGRFDSLWGRLRLSGSVSAEVRELVLWPDRWIDVRVVRQGDGTPLAGEELGLFYREGSDLGPVDSAVSDSAGQARFHHTGQHFAWFWPHTEEMRVRPLEVLPQMDGVLIDPEAPQQALVLELPARRSVRVAVTAPGGLPVAEPGSVCLALREPGDFAVPDPQDLEVIAAADLQAGSALFRGLEPGSCFWAWHRAPQVPPSAPVPGVVAPLEAPEQELRIVQPPSPGPWLLFRVTRADGTVYSGSMLTINGEWSSLKPDAEGRRRLNLSLLGGQRGQPPAALEVRVDAVADFPGRASASLPTMPAGASHDLGTLVLENKAAPLLLSGRVLDSQGQPVVGRNLLVGSIEARRLRILAGQRTGSDGSFICPAGKMAAPAEVHVELTAHGESTRFGPYRVGQTGVEIRLPDSGCLAGSVLLEPAWWRDFVWLRLVRPSSDGSGQEATLYPEKAIDEFGEFQFRARPGHYRLEAGMDSDQAPMLSLPGLEVRAGETNRDPRLQGLVLSGLGRLVEVEVLNERGEPLTEATGSLRHGSQSMRVEEDYGDETADWRGRLFFFVSSDSLSLLIQADGYRSRSLPLPRDRQTVVLAKEVQLEVCLASDWVPVFDSCEFHALARFEDGFDLEHLLEYKEEDGDEPGHVLCCGWSGGSEVVIRLKRFVRTEHGASEQRLLDLGRFAVRETDGRAQVDLKLSPELDQRIGEWLSAEE